jgi:hypothetical protein
MISNIMADTKGKTPHYLGKGRLDQIEEVYQQVINNQLEQQVHP